MDFSNINWEDFFENAIEYYNVQEASMGEQIQALYRYVAKNYNPNISGEGYVYFGAGVGQIGDNEGARVYRIVDCLCELEENGYITSTEAGKLFNHNQFTDSFFEFIEEFVPGGVDLENNICWEGVNGQILLKDGSTCQALNDGFSTMYIQNLKCENVKTLMFGNHVKGEDFYNAFCRTEFNHIMNNDYIKTINNIDKNVFYDVYKAAGGATDEGYQALCDLIKASQIDDLKDVYYTCHEVKKNGKTYNEVDKVFRGSGDRRLIDELLAGENNIVNTADDIIENYCSNASEYTKNIIRDIYKKSNKIKAQIIAEDAERIAEFSSNEKLAKLITNYSDDIIENVGSTEFSKLFTKYGDDIVETTGRDWFVDKFAKYTDDIAKVNKKYFVDNMIKYTDDIVETTGKDWFVDKFAKYTDDIAKVNKKYFVDNLVKYTDDIAKVNKESFVDNFVKYTDNIVEATGKNGFVERFANHADDIIACAKKEYFMENAFKYLDDVVETAGKDNFIKNVMSCSDTFVSKEVGEQFADYLVKNADDVIRATSKGEFVDNLVRYSNEIISTNGASSFTDNLVKYSDDVVSAFSKEYYVGEVIKYADDIMQSSGSEKYLEEILKYADDVVNVAGKEQFINEVMKCSDDLGKVMSNKNCINAISKYGDDILSVAGKDVLELGEYSLSKEAGFQRVFENGMKVNVKHVANNADDIVKNGISFKKIKDGIYAVKEKVNVVKVVNVLTGAVVVVDFGINLKESLIDDMYEDGNYLSGSIRLHKYGYSQLGSLFMGEVFVTAVELVGVVVGASISAPVLAFAGIAGGIIGALWGTEFGEMMGEFWGEIMGYEDNVYGTAARTAPYVADPLVIDFDGDGFETLSVKDGVYFDEDVRGLKEKTAWVAPDDAMLAIDLNDNGKIDDGSELFGTSTIMANGKLANTGFMALSQYDLNKDGIIDINDEIYSKLLVWQDKNSDGISQDSELLSLEEAGIESIELNTISESGRNIAKINYYDGRTTKIGEFDFNANYYDTIEKDILDIPEEIKELPNVKAIGSVESLHSLMAKDETGKLVNYVRQFAESSDKEEKEALVKNVLSFITGADNVESNSRGAFIDAKKLVVVEKLMGYNFNGTSGANPVNTAAPILNNMYNELFNMYYCMLNAQTQLSEFMNFIYFSEDESGRKVINADLFNDFVNYFDSIGEDMSDIVAEMGRYIKYVNIKEPSNFEEYFSEYVNKEQYLKKIAVTCNIPAYFGDNNDNSYSGTNSRDIIFGESGADTLYGYEGNDVIYGDEGNDVLYAGNGNDMLNGGTGNDTLSGETGNDTYVLNLGDGLDTIYDYENSTTSGRADKIVFGEGISLEDLDIQRRDRDLIIKYSETD
ncbi:MAG: hypothetical protein K6G26_05310, partial [Lachnospiraceae bacterium]|nr:hypothetical protein [Lachnospiraceae bacterium]